MKKLSALLLACFIIISITGCTPKATTTSSTTPTERVLSYKDYEDIAEQATCEKLMEYLDDNPAKFVGCDVDSTKYNVSSIKNPSPCIYDVFGKLYLYDYYGDLKDTATFTCEVYVDIDGTYNVKKLNVHM